MCTCPAVKALRGCSLPLTLTIVLEADKHVFAVIILQSLTQDGIAYVPEFAFPH